MSSSEDAPPPVATSPAPPATARGRLLPAQHRLRWGVGAGLVVIGVAGILVNLLLPILSYAVPGGSTGQDWSDLRQPGGLAYEQRLLVWPLVAYAVATVLGGLVAASTYLPKGQEARVRSLAPAAILTAALCGLLLTLTATRWLGFVLARHADLGGSLVRLDTVPYVNLCAGLVLEGGAAWLLTRGLAGDARMRWAAASAGAAGLGLVLLPLLPFAYAASQGTTIRLDEFTLAAMAARGSTWDAPAVLGWARLALWVGLLLGIVTVLARHLQGDGALPRRMHWLCHAVDANVAVILAGFALLGRFYRRLPHLELDVTFGPNFVLPLTLVGLGALWWLHRRAGTRPGRDGQLRRGPS